MKIILGFVAAAAIAAGAYTYSKSHSVSPDVQEVEEAEKLICAEYYIINLLFKQIDAKVYRCTVFCHTLLSICFMFYGSCIVCAVTPPVV